MSNGTLSAQSQQTVDNFRLSGQDEFVEVYDLFAGDTGDVSEFTQKLDNISSITAGPGHKALAEVLDIEFSEVFMPSYINNHNPASTLGMVEGLVGAFGAAADAMPADEEEKKELETNQAYAQTVKFIQDHKAGPVSDAAKAYIDELKQLSDTGFNSSTKMGLAMHRVAAGIEEQSRTNNNPNNPNPFASP